MSARRAAGLVALLSAIAVASLAIPWFEADLPGRAIGFAGTDVAPVLWILIPIAVAVALPVISVARRGWMPDDIAWRSGAFALVCATIGIAICAAVLVWPDATAVATDVTGVPAAPLRRRPAGFVAAGALAGAAALLCAWLAAISAGREGGETSP